MKTLLLGPNPRKTLSRAAVLILLAVILFGYVLMPVRGAGPSMRPAIEDGQLMFVNRLAYARSAPGRGDIVAVRVAGHRVVYVKRIVGLPGERVHIDTGIVHIDDVPLDEPYVRQRRPWTTVDTALAGDEYLVIGDNRDMAVEAHDFGKVKRDRILGRVVMLR